MKVTQPDVNLDGPTSRRESQSERLSISHIAGTDAHCTTSVADHQQWMIAGVRDLLGQRAVQTSKTPRPGGSACLMLQEAIALLNDFRQMIVSAVAGPFAVLAFTAPQVRLAGCRDLPTDAWTEFCFSDG